MERSLHIVVCAKQVFDPDAPPSAFRVDAEKKKVVPEAVPPVVNPCEFIQGETPAEAGISLARKLIVGGTARSGSILKRAGVVDSCCKFLFMRHMVGRRNDI
jgi:hypothetical protein